MRVRRTLYATVTSAALHAALVAVVGWLCVRTGAAVALDASLRALAESPRGDLRADVDILPEALAVAPPERRPPEPPLPAVREGDGTRDVQQDGAPSQFRGRDPHPVAAAGAGAGAPILPESTGRRDDQTVHTQLQ